MGKKDISMTYIHILAPLMLTCLSLWSVAPVKEQTQYAPEDQFQCTSAYGTETCLCYQTLTTRHGHTGDILRPDLVKISPCNGIDRQ